MENYLKIMKLNDNGNASVIASGHDVDMNLNKLKDSILRGSKPFCAYKIHVERRE